jgi:hypothetical protein
MHGFFALMVAVVVPSCGPAKIRLPECWQAGHLKLGSEISGAVLILGSYDQKPMMFPIGCDEGIIADLPDGVTLPLPGGPRFSHPIDDLFWKADVAGAVVTDRITGKPFIRLSSIANPHRVRPRWANGS